MSPPAKLKELIFKRSVPKRKITLAINNVTEECDKAEIENVLSTINENLIMVKKYD